MHQSWQRYPPSKQVYIVDFDEESISRFGNPVSRNVLATLIPKVGAAQPKIIGLNMLLDRPTNQVDDETLVDALTKAGVVIASSGSSAKQMPLRTSYQPLRSRVFAERVQPDY